MGGTPALRLALVVPEAGTQFLELPKVVVPKGCAHPYWNYDAIGQARRVHDFTAKGVRAQVRPCRACAAFRNPDRSWLLAIRHTNNASPRAEVSVPRGGGSLMVVRHPGLGPPANRADSSECPETLVSGHEHPVTKATRARGDLASARGGTSPRPELH